MSAGGGFGPVGPGVGDAPPFAVAGPSSVAVTAERSGSGSFTVSNVAGRAVRARVFVTPGAGADASWFQVVGESERAFPEAGTATVDVALSVPPAVAAGAYSFTVGVALEESPDKVVSGPTVSFTVPEAVKRPFPWWIVIVAAAAVLVLGLGAAAIWWFNRPDDSEPSSSATEEPPVFLTGSFTFQGGPIDVDLDTGTVTAGIRDGADLSLSDADLLAVPASRPLLVFAHTGGVAVVDDPGFATCRTVALADSIEVADGAGTTSVCVLTSDDRIALVEITGSDTDPVNREVLFTVWE